MDKILSFLEDKVHTNDATLFEELRDKGRKDMLELFIKNNKLCGGSYLLLEDELLDI